MTTKSEAETTITWTADDERATVYSLMPRIWSMCLKAGGEEIDLDRGVRGGKKLARTFLVPIKAIRIRKSRTMDKSQMERARASGRRLAAQRMGLDRPT